MATKLDTETLISRYGKVQTKLATVDKTVAKAKETIALAEPTKRELSAKLAMYRAQLEGKGFDVSQLDAPATSENVSSIGTDAETEDDDEDLDAA